MPVTDGSFDGLEKRQEKCIGPKQGARSLFKHWGSAGLPGHYSVRGAVCKMKLGFANVEDMPECSVLILTITALDCCGMIQHS